MLRLSRKELENVSDWKDANIKLPMFDIDQVKEATAKNPTWIHFGAGNIFRGLIANAHQELLNQGLADTGIVAVDSFDFEVIEKVYQPFDNLSLLVLMDAKGEFDKKVIASVVDSVAADYNNPSAIEHIKSVFLNDSLQMVSFTITEKGYGLKNPQGEYYGVVAADIINGPEAPIHTMGMITSHLNLRYLNGSKPLTLVSMDNCSHNGDKLKDGVVTMAKEWLAKGFVEEGFIDYLLDESLITFPLSMIDKITPRPSETIKKHLEDSGLEDMDIIITDKNSYMAPFVNAEICEYLVIEDKFTNGRPELEKAGIIFTDRDTVNKVETMKVTTCLNPLHTALAVSGCILGYTLIADQVKDPALLSLIKTIGYDEGLKVVVNPGIIDPKTFIDEVVNERFANPFIPDTPQRIATDTSQKVGIRFGETIKSYVKDENLKPEELRAIPMAIALWCRYLIGLDDKGQVFELSSDPLLESFKDILKDVELGKSNKEYLKPILSNSNIFGLDLYEVKLGQMIENMFDELTSGIGAVRSTLDKYFV